MALSKKQLLPRDLMPSVKSSAVTDNQKDCWYFGEINRTEAENILIKNGSSEGLFLVRESASSLGDYVLSVVQEETIVHYQIQKRGDDAFFSIEDSRVIHGLDTLIKHYQEDKDSKIFIKSYCPCRSPPPHTRQHGRSNLLHRASSQGDGSVVKQLLKANYRHNLDAKNEQGQTAIHLSLGLKDNSIDILQQLISMGAHVNARDSKGLTPLHYAALSNNSSAIKLLMAKGHADAQCRRIDNGWVPMHEAAHCGYKEVIRTLLQHGAAPYPRCNNDETPKDIAKRLNHTECVHLFDLYANRKCDNCPPRDQWLHNDLSKREEANEIITNAGMRDGMFLVRKSLRTQSPYILVLAHKSRIYNFEIKYKNNFFFIDDGPFWYTLDHLIGYYMLNSDGLPTKLGTSIPIKNNNLSLENIFNDHVTSKPIVFIEYNKLNITNLIGEGEFAHVYRGTWKSKSKTSFTVAMKILKDANKKIVEKNTDNFLREVKVMTELEHPFIIKLLGVCEGPPMMMVQELAPMGSVLNFLIDHSQEVDVAHDIRLWSAQIAFGMKYLESKHFVHRDLAARNILLASFQQIKITDFGLSRHLRGIDDYYRANLQGKWPIKWYAPESINFGQFTSLSDVWSYGVVIWELYSFGAQPYSNIKGMEFIKHIEEGNRLEKPLNCSDGIYSLLSLCWSFHPKDRPTFTTLCHFFTDDSSNECIRDELKCSLNSAI